MQAESALKERADEYGSILESLGEQLARSIEGKDSAQERLDLAKTAVANIEAKYAASKSPFLLDQLEKARERERGARSIVDKLNEQQEALARKLRAIKKENGPIVYRRVDKKQVTDDPLDGLKF